MDKDQKEFKCKECGMRFTDSVRLERHFKVAHKVARKSKHGGFMQKWYWEN